VRPGGAHRSRAVREEQKRDGAGDELAA